MAATKKKTRTAKKNRRTTPSVLSPKFASQISCHPERIPACRDESKDLRLFFAHCVTKFGDNTLVASSTLIVIYVLKGHGFSRAVEGA